MLYNQHLLTCPEIKRYKLHNLLTHDETIVTMEMLKEGFSDSPEREAEFKRIIGNRSNAWFLEEIFEEN